MQNVHGTVVTWSPTQIVVTVPTNVLGGFLYVEQNGADSSSVPFSIVPPTVTSISPNPVAVGAQLTINGSGFGASQGTGFVSMQNVHGTVVTWSPTQIVVTVPTNVVGGFLYVQQNGADSSSVPFSIVPPTITSISPNPVGVGAQLTINGSGFGASQGTGFVSMQNVHGTVVTWSPTQIVVTVPDGTSPGNLYVQQNGADSNSVPFTIIFPTITGVSPASGGIGTPVTISGNNFGSTQGNSAVTFDGQPATPTAWGNTQITAPAPTGTGTGPVVVVVHGEHSNGITFTYTGAPTITSISPTLGRDGISVTINGSLFGGSVGSSTVTFNGQVTTPTSWSASQIIAPAPAGVTTGNVVVTVNNIQSNGVLFVAKPTIASLSPTSGAVTAPVTITGTNFGSIRGTVTFNGITATTTSWNTTTIVAPVPTGATTGPVIVTVDGNASNAKTFTVTPPPVITSLSPTSGPVGILVTISGTTFGASQGTNTVSFNGTIATPTTWNATTIKVPVPAGATTGNVVVTVSGVASNGVLFTVLPTPNITSLAPTSGPVGTLVAITGTNFGSTPGTSTLKFNGTNATPTSWSANQILALVPTGATTGPVVVTVNGVASNGVTFTVTTAPIITSIAPPQGPVGILVTINGGNFGASPGTSTVKFNGTTATPRTWSATTITVPVPAGATTGPLVVTVGGVSSNGVTFTVLPTPNITSLSPTSGGVGALVTITGTNFGTLATGIVTFNGVAGAPTGWTATQILVPVPTGATTGPVVVNANGVLSNGVTFTVLPTPTITQVVPGAAGVGQPVTITGVNFGSPQGSSTVKFNGTAGAPTIWTDTQIVVAVPVGATTGNLVVTVNQVSSTGIPFPVLPTPSITPPLSPTSGPVGTAVTINGANFGSNPLVGLVTFNGVPTIPATWTTTRIVAPVPVGAITGPVIVAVNGVPSNPVTFTVTGPSITSLTPPSGPVTTLVTIAGAGFGSTATGNSVTFNGVVSVPTSWAPAQIQAPVPAGALTGPVVVTVNGIASNPMTFTVTNPGPSITSLSLPQGPALIGLVITGQNFGAAQGTVALVPTAGGNSVPLTVLANGWSATQITVQVPAGTALASYNVVVTAGGVASNPVPFAVVLSFVCN